MVEPNQNNISEIESNGKKSSSVNPSADLIAEKKQEVKSNGLSFKEELHQPAVNGISKAMGKSIENSPGHNGISPDVKPNYSEKFTVHEEDLPKLNSNGNSEVNDKCDDVLTPTHKNVGLDLDFEKRTGYDGNQTLTENDQGDQSGKAAVDEIIFDKFSSVSVECDETGTSKVLQRTLESDDSENEDDSPTTPQEMKCSHKKSHSNTNLEWFDNQHQADTIHRLNVFRRSKQFCDVVLLVGGREMHCHRVVVGGASRAIFDELSRGEQESGPLALIPLDVARPGLLPAAVETLIDYMYTSRLSIPSELLTAVYRASLQLGVERVTPLCRKYIIAELDSDQCVQMRRLAQNNRDNELKQYVDNFIEENFETVSSSNELLSLPRIKMEVLVSPSTSVINMLTVNLRDGGLCLTAVSWVRDIVQQKGGQYWEDLTEQIQRVPLEDLNNVASSSTSYNNSHIRRTSQGQDSDYGKSTDVVGKSNGMLPNVRLSRSSSMDSITSSDSTDSASRVHCCPDGEWKVIAFTQSFGSEHVIALCCLGDVLCTLSIRLPNFSLSNGDLTNGHDVNGYHSNVMSISSASASTSCSSSIGSVSQLSHLCHARCAAGVAQINGKMIVAGGFNQSECLDSVECFDATANRWNTVSHMSEKRARFSVAVLRGFLYAVGGSSGSHDQMSVERYEPSKDAWTHVQPLLMSCSESGVAVLNDLLYCVGGVQKNTGVAGLKTCQVYDPDKDQWNYTASLHTGRSSLGVASLGGYLYAVAGSDGWKCLGTAERLDPSSGDHWTFTAALNVHRRGLGITEHNDALHCVGGFDGQSFLSSVERYCPNEGDVWTLTTTSLNVPRNNVGLTSLNGSVFAVGGFTGRHFLSSMEILDESNNEWTNHDSQVLMGGASETNESD